MTRAERRYLRLADHVLAVSERNKNFFTRYIPQERISVVPTGVDTEYFHPEPGAEADGHVVFTGSMDWMPNHDAVEWYHRDILPLIRQEVPGLATWIVGRNPSASLRSLDSDTFRVTGSVDDVRPYLRRCPVYIVPMRSGSGTRLKIFEAMAAGKAIVSTSTGAEGLPVEHERSILLADSPRDFARQVIRLLADPALRQRLASAARELVERNHSWGRVAEQFETILVDAARPPATHKTPPALSTSP